MDVEPIVRFLAPQALAWIVSQRDHHRSQAEPIRGPLTGELAQFFRMSTLDRARVRVVDTVENPPFYPLIRQAAPGIKLIDFAEMSGVTFDDTILIHRGCGPGDFRSLMFHELVHVAQYAALGPEGFADRYVRGWALGGMQYANIPLEKDAYDLQARFDNREPTFSVEAAVRLQLASRSAT